MWQAKKDAGALKRPSLGELFRLEYRTTTIVTTLMMALGYAIAYGANQQMPRIVPGLAEVRVLSRSALEHTVSVVQMFHETGGLVGRILLAYLAVRIAGRRRLLRLFLFPGLVVLPVVFMTVSHRGVQFAEWGIFFVGLTLVGQFSFWGNYLPRVYPTHLRGTGESFAANIGGRMLGTSAAIATTQLANVLPWGASPASKLAYAAGIIGTSAYVLGIIACMWLPEPKREELPE
jgi:hypothetical protein